MVLMRWNNSDKKFFQHIFYGAPNFSGSGPTSISGCLPITPSSTTSESAVVSGLNQGRVRVQTPSTPELYSVLNLSYNCRLVRSCCHFNACREKGMNHEQKMSRALTVFTNKINTLAGTLRLCIRKVWPWVVLMQNKDINPTLCAEYASIGVLHGMVYITQYVQYTLYMKSSTYTLTVLCFS